METQGRTAEVKEAGSSNPQGQDHAGQVEVCRPRDPIGGEAMIGCSHFRIPIDPILHNLVTVREAGINGKQSYYHEDCYAESMGVEA